ncbi:hypothetical protein FA09DRAFT_291881, partial [Tilletiopsis washingtonensis]
GDVSRFKAGEFLASLVCLIPVQLGITRDNRFVSFYDGINDPEFEQSLLGASAQHIASRLSLGHLESILGNLYSTADVKVVSSLGEQSTGKSFALNHLLDTLFEGAATRTTEGVWMSVVPSSGATVYVVLDFEGVQSVERSVQEDALLVLMNAAISNLVIYRNSFSLSREIRTLFGAFQASAGILNPTANPELFRGSLAVVIKDVMMSDRDEAAAEFYRRFQSIVATEQGGNFVSRLFGGKLAIVPWPGLQDPAFYSEFGCLAELLNAAEVSHPPGGAFLRTLKTLMAQIQSFDWTPIGASVRKNRLAQLSEHLESALILGGVPSTVEPAVLEPLMNLDTDEPINEDHSQFSL